MLVWLLLLMQIYRKNLRIPRLFLYDWIKGSGGGAGVADEAGEAGAFDRGVSEKGGEGGLGHVEDVGMGECAEGWAEVEFGDSGG